MSQVVQSAKGWDEWVEFMVKTHQYMDWDVRISKQFEFLQKFLQLLPLGGKILDHYCPVNDSLTGGNRLF